MSDNKFTVDGSSAIVTGASSGIGRRIAEGFAAQGVDTTICSREQDNVDPVAEEINDGDTPGRVLPSSVTFVTAIPSRRWSRPPSRSSAASMCS
nr:SDR family NAD(P)-dependent oxidoreductase [Natronomonas gomsonensis]